MTRSRLHLFAALAMTLAVSPASAADGDYALTNANLFDGVNDAVTENVTVLVSDGRIERIATGNVSVPRGYTVIDVEGNYLMPGMIDVHTHMNTIDRAQRALDSGVTTVRVAGSSAYQDIALRELVSSGRLAGPEVLASGLFVVPDLGESVLADQFRDVNERVKLPYWRSTRRYVSSISSFSTLRSPLSVRTFFSTSTLTSSADKPGTSAST